MDVDYDRLAEHYRNHRRPDPRIAARIQSHIEGARRVLNVGAGIGSYEPDECEVVAIEPSHEMLMKRDNARAALAQGVSEALPFGDDVFDVTMGILTLHHWSDIVLGLREMVRVSRDKVILFTWIGYASDFWLEDYIPEIVGVDYELFPTLAELHQILGGISVETIEIPYDCSDGFMCAYWRRPEAYLDPEIRKAISTFSRISDIQEGLAKLRNDIDDGLWGKKHKHLLERESLDLGYRLVVCRVQSA